MSKDLIIREDVLKSFPQLREGLGRVFDLFSKIRNFKDVERYFLKGVGLSPNTYSAYLTAVKQLYEFTDHLNPLQVTASDIEAFYDHVLEQTSKNTASARIAGLKRFFRNVEQACPGYQSPFESMPKKLLRKISRTKKTKKKHALTPDEVQKLLGWLSKDESVRGLRKYAIVYFLVTSGLRNAELCNLKWKDIDLVEGVYYANFTGKGDKEANQELWTPAVEACKRYFYQQFKRFPRPEDHPFWTVPQLKIKPRPMYPADLCDTISKLGKEQDVIKRDLHWTPHLFRRSYASGLYKSGMKVVALKEKTRHSDIGTLVEHYIDDSEPARGYLEKMLNNGKSLKEAAK